MGWNGFCGELGVGWRNVEDYYLVVLRKVYRRDEVDFKVVMILFGYLFCVKL